MNARESGRRRVESAERERERGERAHSTHQRTTTHTYRHTLVETIHTHAAAQCRGREHDGQAATPLSTHDHDRSTSPRAIVTTQSMERIDSYNNKASENGMCIAAHLLTIVYILLVSLSSRRFFFQQSIPNSLHYSFIAFVLFSPPTILHSQCLKLMQAQPPLLLPLQPHLLSPCWAT